MNELVFQPHRNSLILRSRPHPSESTFHGRDPLRLCLLQPRGVLPEPYRMTHRVSNRGTDQCGYWTVGPFNTCLAPYLYTFGLWVIGAALHGDLEQAVLEVGAYPVPVYTFRQVHAPSEVPVVAFSGVVTHVLRLAPALPVDDQNAAGEGDLDVILFHAGEFATYHEIVTLGEYVGRRDPGGRVGPAVVFRSATLGVLPHPGHLAHVGHQPPKGVTCPAHLRLLLWSGNGLALAANTTGGWPKPPARAVFRGVGLTPASLAAGPALLVGVLCSHLLRRRGAPRLGHRPPRLGRLTPWYHGHLLRAQRFHDGEAQPDQDQHEGRRRRDGHRLKGQESRVHRALDGPGQQTDRRSRPGEDAPHDNVPRLGVQVTLGREHPHDHRGSIGPTDKEQRDQDDRDQRR